MAVRTKGKDKGGIKGIKNDKLGVLGKGRIRKRLKGQEGSKEEKAYIDSREKR